MKYIILLILLITFVNKSNSQPLKSLSDDKYASVKGAYYKDIFNTFDNFTGNWQFTNGLQTLNITLRKHLSHYNSYSNIYEDLIIGEYKYSENGVEKVNTLSRLNIGLLDLYDHSVVGNAIIKKTSAPICNGCSSNEKRLVLAFSDPTRPGVKSGLSGKIVLRRVDSGGVQKLELILKQTGSVIPDDNETFTENAFNVPWGTYILTKIN